MTIPTAPSPSSTTSTLPPAPSRPWIHTPLIPSATLSTLAGCTVLLKLDLHQPSGSFKSRGVGYQILQILRSHSLVSSSTAHIYSSSGGNAGLAAVHASRMLGARCTVVVPESTSAFMAEKVRAAGAEQVLVCGKSWVEADQHVRMLVEQDKDGYYCAPFDHPDVWEGNATLVDEILKDMNGDVPDAVVASVGGGGLLVGLQLGLERSGLEERTRMVAVETRGAESLNASLREGRLVTLEEITSIATSLGARTVAEKAFEVGSWGNVISRVVSDGAAARACVRFAEEERMLVEAACGASLAAVYELGLRKMMPELTSESKVVVVVCGGSNVNLEILEKYRTEYPLQQKA
ncbi:putative serine family amino acid catabolism-related protein [Tricharina praecox]|uniref:putative serine family amino acid catabolism-related protein n=1 Tax=Tricharina praecox TaxID=43433 RepID=UPI00221FC223|nr:putative serine family amino acid catabolism-related protein [Tricharina praecox]KAI5849975.1 putative serine family amino acid catabolism-related protein [Tricharina praecox]